jgi:hypothetical protein
VLLGSIFCLAPDAFAKKMPDVTTKYPGKFKPRPEYFREMKKYGILPASFDPEKDVFNVYDLDQKYWESLWYYPEGSKRPEFPAQPVKQIE